MRRFTPENVFLTISAIGSRCDLLDLHCPEAMLKGELAGMASQVVLLSDSSKF